MRRSDAFPKRWGHATFALAVATCAMLLALGAKAPAFGDESASAIQSEVETVNVQFSNVERPDGDYEKWAWPVKHDLYNIGDTGGPIMWMNDYGSILWPWVRDLEPGFTVSGQGRKVSDEWIVVDQSDDGRYASSVWGTVSDTDNDGVSDHIDIVARYDKVYTPQVLNERGESIPVTKVTCEYGSMYPHLQGHTWDAPFRDISIYATWGDTTLPQKFPVRLTESNDLVITSANPNMQAASVEFVVGYDPVTNNISEIIDVRPDYKQIDDPVETVKPIPAPPVKGDAGITSSGTLQGPSIPVDAEVSLEASLITKGEGYDTLLKEVESSKLYGVFNVDMTVNGNQIHDGFGTLALSFPVDAKYNGYSFRIVHLHNDGTTTVEQSVAKDGLVTIRVTDLSTFALEIGEKVPTSTEQEQEQAPKTPTALPSSERGDEQETGGKAVQLAATGDSSLAFLALAMTAIAGGAAIISYRKISKKNVR